MSEFERKQDSSAKALRELTEKELALGLLFGELPPSLVRKQTTFITAVVSGTGNLVTSTARSKNSPLEEVFTVSMLPLQLMRAVLKVVSSCRGTPYFSSTTCAHLNKVVEMTRGASFQDVSKRNNLNLDAAIDDVRAGQVGEELVMYSLLVLTEVLSEVALQDNDDKKNFKLFGQSDITTD